MPSCGPIRRLNPLHTERVQRERVEQTTQKPHNVLKHYCKYGRGKPERSSVAFLDYYARSYPVVYERRQPNEEKDRQHDRNVIQLETEEDRGVAVTKRDIAVCDYPVVLQDAVQYRKRERDGNAGQVLKVVPKQRRHLTVAITLAGIQTR